MDSMTPKGDLAATETIERIVGWNIARLREAQPWSQATFSERLAVTMNKKPSEGLSRQAISNIERGRRSFSVSDLMMFALVFSLPPSALLVIPAHVTTIQIGEVKLASAYITDPKWLRDSTAGQLAQLANSLSGFNNVLHNLMEMAYTVDKQRLELIADTTFLKLRTGLEEKGATMPYDYPSQ